MRLRLFLHPMKILVLLLSSKVFHFGHLIVERILLLAACFGSICQSFDVNMMVLVGILRQCLVARSFDVIWRDRIGLLHRDVVCLVFALLVVVIILVVFLLLPILIKLIMQSWFRLLAWTCVLRLLTSILLAGHFLLLVLLLI